MEIQPITNTREFVFRCLRREIRKHNPRLHDSSGRSNFGNNIELLQVSPSDG